MGQNKVMTFPNGTYSSVPRSLSFVAPAPYNKVVIRLVYTKSNGTAWFDALSLLRSP